MEEPLVSVLMTAYNREKYIAEAIESVISQTYANWELIITDDRSSDNTLNIALSYADVDSRIHVYQNKVNLGDYPNRNQAAKYAKGKYIKYLDADDLLYPWALQILVSMMEAHPEAPIGLCSNSKEKLPRVITSSEAYRLHYLCHDYIFARSPLTVIMSRDAFNKVGGFSGHQHVGDFELWNVFAREFSVLLLPHGWCWYRVHDQQQSVDNRTDPFVPYKYIRLAYDYLTDLKCPLSDKERIEAVKILNLQALKSVLHAMLSFKFASALKMIHLYTPYIER